MKKNPRKPSQFFSSFFASFFAGALGALAGGILLMYVLNMTHVIAISVVEMPDIQSMLVWAYDNLRLSIIPFAITLVLYFNALFRLQSFLKKEDAPLEKIAQGEQNIDIWINLFFGIGVIWTAIGMRGALLEGLGGLDAGSAAQEGAFSILTKLVEGGILIALSTTIFGSVGGYGMRVLKSLTVGIQLQRFYVKIDMEHNRETHVLLKSIEERLASFSATPSEKFDPQINA